jgi:hypothetical protein
MSIILDGTAGETFPSWTTAGRPASPATGQTGFNSTLGILETYNGTTWVNSNLPVPTSAGSVIFTTDGTNWSSTPKLTSGTAVALAGANVDFTIPSWAKRITIIGVDITTGIFSVQLGTSGGIVTTGYYSYWGSILGSSTSVAGGTNTANIIYGGQSPVGVGVITNLNGNTWASSFTGRSSDRIGSAYGSITLASALTTVRFVTTATTGNVNIIYE